MRPTDRMPLTEPLVDRGVRSRGARHFTERAAQRHARQLATAQGVLAIAVVRISRLEWETTWLAEPGAKDGYHR